jgi:tetratricopeptide (TPR) repeat protein
MRDTKSNQKIIFQAALIIILGFAVYANSLSAKFIWDDECLVEDNPCIKSLSEIPKVFTQDTGASSGISYHSYRPLQIITYAIDYSFWLLNPSGYHFTNIFLHILVSLCVLWLINILFKDSAISFLAAAFFLVHPVHTQAVSYISGRADSLALLFMLLSLIFYIKVCQAGSAGFFSLALFSFALALLSRENSLILPVLLLLYHLTFRQKLKFRVILAFVIVALTYILLRLVALRHLLAISPPPLSQRIPGFFVAVANYLWLLLLPVNLHIEYGQRLFRFSDPLAITGMLSTLLLLAIAFRKINSNKLVFFCIAWFFLALLPQSNIYPLNAYMAEHWLYAPSLGFCLILAYGLVYFSRQRNIKIFIPAAVFILVFYAYFTARQNFFWQDPLIFFQRNLKYSPDSSLINNNLGKIYYSLGREKEAIALFRRAIEIYPGNINAYNNLASVYYNAGRKEEAIALFKKAIEINPARAALLYYNLAVIYLREGRASLAAQYCGQAMESGYKVNPEFLKALKLVPPDKIGTKQQ